MNNLLKKNQERINRFFFNYLASDKSIDNKGNILFISSLSELSDLQSGSEYLVICDPINETNE